MKLSLQLTGNKFNIYAIIKDDGSIPVLDYLDQLKTNDPPSFKSLLNLLKMHADHGPIKNAFKSRPIKGYNNLFEFKSKQGGRILYCYLPRGITVLIDGFPKGTPTKELFKNADEIKDQLERTQKNG
ncbi:MAG: hypothetical protein GX226_04420 [Dehalococcoidales bacterium]|nr:hypothetical protein [Dehalococcoidales bacterium]